MPLTIVLERYGILGDLKRIGAQPVGTCPIHQGSNKKQFVVNPGTNEWKCFGDCDAGGATLEFVAAMEKTTTVHAAQLMASWFAIRSGSQVNQPAQRRMEDEW